MTRMTNFRFEQQVAILIGLLCLALVGSLLTGAIWIGRRQSTALISANMAGLAGNMASSLDTAMFERFREIRVISELRPLQNAWRSDPDQVRQVLDALHASLPTYAWIGFATPDGHVRAATGHLLEGQSVLDRPWFKRGLIAPTVSDVHEAKLLASYLEAPAGAEPFRFVDIAMPVFDQRHELVGVLGAHLSWTWTADVRQRLLSLTGSGQGTEVWILSAGGRMLLGPASGSMPYDPKRLTEIAGQRGGVFEDTNRQDPILTGFALTSGFRDYPGLGWIVIARQPMSVAFEPVTKLMRTMLIMGSIVAFLSILLAWVIARRAAAPLRQLTRAALLIGRDPLTTMLPRLGGSREFMELSASLRSLLRRIGNAEQQLQDAKQQSLLHATKLNAEINSLQHAAATDPLTGLLNRRAFLASADDAMVYFRRYARSITMLVVDIDVFKRVNDTYGHAAGDAVIRVVGDMLSSALRTTDKIGRFGGEEFVVLLREISAADALALADRIRATVAATTIQSGDSRVSVTVSIGAAIANTADSDVQALIERADRALYSAKHRGRNCVVLDEMPHHALQSQAA